MTDLNLEGMVIAPNVVETIVCMAVQDVEGVAGIGGSATTSSLRSMFGANLGAQGVEVEVDGDALSVSVHVDVYHGTVLPDVAAQVRSAVAEAVTTQVGLDVSAVDVYIDGIEFVH